MTPEVNARRFEHRQCAFLKVEFAFAINSRTYYDRDAALEWIGDQCRRGNQHFIAFERAD